MDRRKFLNKAAITSACAVASPVLLGAKRENQEKPERCKITVLKTFLFEEWCKETDREPKVCPVLNEGQEFIVSTSGKVPDGICQVAWADIRFSIYMVLQGYWNTSIVCCGDHVRPVYFKLEGIA